jgi:hypothetical protein
MMHGEGDEFSHTGPTQPGSAPTRFRCSKSPTQHSARAKLLTPLSGTFPDLDAIMVTEQRGTAQSAEGSGCTIH